MTRMILLPLVALLAAAPALGPAQETQVALDAVAVAPGEDVEITSDTLEVNRETGVVVFAGSVVVTQGPLQLLANEVTVLYAEATDTRPAGVEQVTAVGDVLFTSGEDAAESATATYLPDLQELRMSGDVMLKQGPVVVAGDALVLDLATGLGQMEGRVRTVLRPDPAE